MKRENVAKLLLLMVVLAISCSDESDSNQSKKESQDAVQTQSTGMSWTVPDGWTQETPSSAMRRAQFSLAKVETDPEDATVVVFYFKGEGGGVQANIQRWISQFKATEADVEREVKEEEKSEVNGLPLTVVDVKGTYLFKVRPMASTATEKPGFRMQAAVFETSIGPWFVKFVGPEKTVDKWEESFRTFLHSFRLAS